MKLILTVFVIYLITPSLSFMHKKDFGTALYEGSIKSHNNCKLYTGTTDELIDQVNNGKFDDNDSSIQRYTFCLWNDLGELDENTKLIESKLASYLTPLNREDLSTYAKCNHEALNLPEKCPVKIIWEMQKCIFKNIPNERYIFF